MIDDFFHILNRGVEEREIFYSEKDYFRFAHNLHDFNNTKLAVPYPLRRSRAKHVGHPMSNKIQVPREEIIDLLCWCLMPNHAHLLAQERIDMGASNFSKKIFGGYTKYINEIRKRKGVLFQGKSKIILVGKDAHFFYLPFYIMANPISLIEPKWRERGIVRPERAINFLENYRWSSFQDLIGKDNFPEIVNKGLFYEVFGTDEKRFRKDFINWLKERQPSIGHPMSN